MLARQCSPGIARTTARWGAGSLNERQWRERCGGHTAAILDVVDGAPDDGEPDDGAPDDGAPDDGAPRRRSASTTERFRDGAPGDGAPHGGAPHDGAPGDGDPGGGDPGDEDPGDVEADCMVSRVRVVGRSLEKSCGPRTTARSRGRQGYDGPGRAAEVQIVDLEARIQDRDAEIPRAAGRARDIHSPRRSTMR